MDPVSLAVISIGASAAGGGVSALGALQSGQAANSMYQYKAGVAAINEKIAKQNAEYTLKVGETEAQASGMKTRFAVGSSRVAGGASGLDVNTGSKSRVIESTEAIGEQNQAVVRSDAAKRAYGYEVEAMQDTAQGQLYKMAGEQSVTASKYGAASSVLGAAGSVSDKWLTAQSRGIFS